MNFKKIILLILSIITVGCTCALVVKIAIGVDPWEGLAVASSGIINMEVGTIGIALNCTCIFVELILLKKEFGYKQLLQIPMSLLIGLTINFFLYTIFNYEMDITYIQKLLFYILSISISACGVGTIMLLDVVTFPLEGLCQEISKKTKYTFPRIRQYADILFIITTVLLCYFNAIPLTVREGTIIAMCIFGPVMGIYMKCMNPIIKKHILTK